MPTKLTKKIRKAMGLIEVLIAVTVSVIALTAMVSMVVTALRSSLQSRMYLEATKLASQQLERVRAYRDSKSWAEFTSELSGCYAPSSTDIGNTCHLLANLGRNNGIFDGTAVGGTGISYYFYITDLNGDQISSSSPPSNVRVTAIAFWDGGAKQTTMITDLSNWQGK